MADLVGARGTEPLAIFALTSTLDEIRPGGLSALSPYKVILLLKKSL